MNYAPITLAEGIDKDGALSLPELEANIEACIGDICHALGQNKLADARAHFDKGHGMLKAAFQSRSRCEETRRLIPEFFDALSQPFLPAREVFYSGKLPDSIMRALDIANCTPPASEVFYSGALPDSLRHIPEFVGQFFAIRQDECTYRHPQSIQPRPENRAVAVPSDPLNSLFGNLADDLTGFAEAAGYHWSRKDLARAGALLVGRCVAQATLEDLCGPYGRAETPVITSPERRGSPERIANLFQRAGIAARLAQQ